MQGNPFVRIRKKWVCPTFYTSEKISHKDTKTQRNHKETS
ncbi:Uncharacterized protein dnm_096210 [Desulfonema magnum]|uniref:Uncharacterized protein n=1 Tax=Desulfonema magnum TaxID=45655 RepID=A0A975BZ03_9BACT|nr:Uncharacterized protein dnm_096210 [Desulfonema magnum]